MKHLILSVLLALTAPVFAEVTLAPLFTDNMVVQRQSDVPFWGSATVGATIIIEPSWTTASYSTTVADDGTWRVAVPTPDAGGPYTITITESIQKTPTHRNPRTKCLMPGRQTLTALTLENVLVGEVWLCSGQSNMEMPVEGWGQVMNYSAERAAADQWPTIRLFRVEKAKSAEPLTTLDVANGGWTPCSSETIAEFSATAYFFGRALQQSLGVPIGLIQSAWGGTIIEAWTSRESFASLPEQDYNISSISNLPATDAERLTLYHEQYAAWVDSINTIDRGYREGWATLSYDDSQWGDYAMPSLDSKRGTLNALWWARKIVDIPASWAGRDIILNIGAPDDHDVTFFNGVQVGSTLGCIEQRHYRVPGALVKGGKAVIAVRIHDNGGLTGIGYADEQFDITLADAPSETLSLRGIWKYQPSTRSALLPPVPPNTERE